MTTTRLADVLRQAGVPDLVEILSDRMTPAELELVLVETQRRRAGRLIPTEVLALYQGDRRVWPSPATPDAFSVMDQAGFGVAGPTFTPLELSPICPLGTVSVVAPVDPTAAWGSGAGNEVVSDCLGVLALECARRRWDADRRELVRLCASHRELHVPFSAPFRSEVHARVFGLCTGGAAGRQARFATDALREHIGVHLRLLERLRRLGYQIGAVRVELVAPPGAGIAPDLVGAVTARLAAEHPDVRLTASGGDYPARRHFGPVGFVVGAEDAAGVEHRVGLGGVTDWTRQLLAREDEQLLVSTVATERLCEVFGLPSLHPS